MTERVRIIVRGRVQGVGFRASAHAAAIRLGIVGFVRNRPDGTVEIVAEGERPDIDRMVEWARIGPSMSRVDTVELEVSEPSGEWSTFDVR